MGIYFLASFLHSQKTPCLIAAILRAWREFFAFGRAIFSLRNVTELVLESAIGECRRILMGRRRLALGNPTERGRDFLIFVPKTFHKVPFSIERTCLLESRMLRGSGTDRR